MVRIENDVLKVEVKPHGAELSSLFHKQHQLEYLWQAGDIWPKHAPLLFPIVGQLRDNIYYHNGKAYTLPRHGFAREKNFSLIEHGPNRLVFRLMDDESTFQIYPFHFILETEYALKDEGLHVTFIVENKGKENMFFSVGGHPAFKIPLVDNSQYEDYYIEFGNEESADRWPLVNGLIAENGISFLNNLKKLKISRDLFNEDALVFSELKSKEIAIKSEKHQRGLTFEINDCPYLGLWAAKNADFVCIEPWFGIADSVDSDQKLINKKGIQSLAPGNQFTYTYAIRLF